MPYDPEKHHRRSIRLQNYDYTQAGAYFVTICTYQRQCLLGEIEDGQIRLSDIGAVAQAAWLDLPDHYPRVALDVFVLMPNHVHGIVVMRDVVGAGLQTRPYETPSVPTKRCALPEIIRGFKTYSARRVNELRGVAGVPLWQRNYYEHIIRDENERGSIQEYIVNNPAKWADDMDHPVHLLPQA